METFKSFVREIYEVNDQSFTGIALDIFRYQAENNPVYAAFLKHLKIHPGNVSDIESIPFLPVSFFKTHTIRTGVWTPETMFTSSGTTGQSQSRHPVPGLDQYLSNTVTCFQYFFGPLQDYHFFALLPSYLEREGSSLIAMMDNFIRKSESAESGFYLHDHDLLLRRLTELRNSKRKIILWGVSFALLDLAEGHNVDLAHCRVFETGGMKGRRREITREELHAIVKQRLNVPEVYSEYGMTELFSQAYTTGQQTFRCPPVMKVIGRDLSDPFQKGIEGETCGINVIDLANWQTISFVETEDVGKVFPDGSFEILGRMDNSEIRGCNLMLSV